MPTLSILEPPKITKEPRMSYNIDMIGPGWTLFLDRDGVINSKLENDYVLTPEQFIFIPGSLEAISILTDIFRRIIIVTNQQCIGRGLVSKKEIDNIHKMMKGKIEESGGKITDIFVSPWLESENNSYRKPGIGMAEAAASKYGDIEFSRSVMAGDSITDMIFGKRAGMITVLISESIPEQKNLSDLRYNSLLDFALSLK